MINPDYDPESLKRLIEGSGVFFRQTSVSYVFTCPRCQKANKLYIRKLDGRFVCFRCKETDGFQGKPEWALTEILGMPVREIQEILYGARSLTEGERLTINLRDFYGEEENDVLEDLPDELPEVWPDPDFAYPGDPRFAKGKAYLEGRGISEALATEYRLAYWTAKSRVVFPVYVDGKLRGWQARSITPGDRLKILSTTGLTGGSVMMFQDRLQGDTAILCEGPVDAIKCHLAAPAVASMGKAVTPRQLEILVRAGIRRLYIGFDPDAANELSRIAQTVYHMDIYRMLPPPHREDLGDCTLEEAAQAMKDAEWIRPGMVFTYCAPPKRWERWV